VMAEISVSTRNTFRLASRRDGDALIHDVKPIYTAVNAEAARACEHHRPR